MFRCAEHNEEQVVETHMTLNIAIIGSGPAGFYTVGALLKSKTPARIDIIDRLPTPYGLVRGGVAPDHQSTKKVTAAYEKLALSDQVSFVGNVNVGSDVSLDELRGFYDAVVLAVGSPLDRPLSIPGADKQGMVGAAAFVGWYNGHPDFTDLAPNLNTTRAVVIGAGNVAIDVARILAKTRNELSTSDITEYAATAIEASPITDIHMIARRDAPHAKFTNQELREMGELEDAAPIVDPADLEPAYIDDLDARDQRLAAKNSQTMKSFLDVSPEGKSKRVHFDFCASPVEVLGEERVTGLKLERNNMENGRAVASGEFYTLECGLVVTAIGYQGSPLPGADFDEKGGVFVHDDGRIAPGLYATGWCKRGPSGVIGTNKADGDQTAKQIIADLTPSDKAGRDGLLKMLSERNATVVTFEDWKKIEAAEKAAAKPPAPRQKIVAIDEMLAALD